MSTAPWYRRYPEFRSRVEELREQSRSRSEQLGADAQSVFGEVRNEIIARVVHESNWQEGIYLDEPRTKELAEAVFEDEGMVPGPHLDMERFLKAHRIRVTRMKRKDASKEEIATYNLSRAHVAFGLIGIDLANRQAATLVQALKQFELLYETAKEHGKVIEQGAEDAIQRGLALVRDLEASESLLALPVTGGITTEGELVSQLSEVEFDSLLHPMRVDYIHFLHRLVGMGIASPKKWGAFRRTSVHVGRPEPMFPPPGLVPGLMEEFCEQFPTILPSTVKYDPILKAAEASYRFVRIHPYADGNGRVSRLLMNLVLWQHFPPVWIKADKKGRHRYAQALKRANRGSIEPLACLIAMSLIEVYEMLIDAISPF